MSKGKDKYRWADGGNAPKHGRKHRVERNLSNIEYAHGMVLPQSAVQQQSRHWSHSVSFSTKGGFDRKHTINDGRVFDLMARGYTGEEIEQLQELVDNALYAGPDRVFFRHQARKKGKPVFAYNRLYKKSHEPGPKRLAGTMVWQRELGFIKTFPEVGDA